jgi:hypothetical protein
MAQSSFTSYRGAPPANVFHLPPTRADIRAAAFEYEAKVQLSAAYDAAGIALLLTIPAGGFIATGDIALASIASAAAAAFWGASIAYGRNWLKMRTPK